MAQDKEKSYVWTEKKAELLLNITLEYKVNKTQKMPSDASRLECGGRIDGHLSRRM